MKRMILVLVILFIGIIFYFEIPLTTDDTKMQMEFKEVIPTKEELEDTLQNEIVQYRLEPIETPIDTGIKSFLKKKTSYYLGIYDYLVGDFSSTHMIINSEDLKKNIEFEFAYNKEDLRRNYLDIPDNSKKIVENEQYSLYVNLDHYGDQSTYTPYGYIQKDGYIIYYHFDHIPQVDFDHLQSDLINIIENLIPIL